LWESLLVSARPLRRPRDPPVRVRLQALRPHRDEGRLRRGAEEGNMAVAVVVAGFLLGICFIIGRTVGS